LRETLFNVIAPRIVSTRFLDLCAGSGAVGIEALSRGASSATFVDQSRKMCGLVQANLDLCKVPEEQSEVVNMAVENYLKQAATRRVEPWGLVFFDPPYKEDYLTVLRFVAISTNGLLKNDGLLIAEHHHKNELPAEAGDLTRVRVLKQGDSALSFYQRMPFSSK
jgi:16S rRNA (guanine(966)-N(2))-methyltransferase RsmD